MTDDGIMCITKTIDDSTLWIVNYTLDGTSFFNKRTKKYACPIENGGVGSWSDKPKYFNVGYADLYQWYGTGGVI